MKKIIIATIVLGLIISCNRSGKAPVMATDNTMTQESPHGMTGSPGKVTADKVDVKIEKSEGTVTIAELLADRSDYDGKVITIKGEITKVNRAIMGKNWFHIQDGTDHEGAYDLTVTTQLDGEVGDVVTLTGKIVLNKDFGYGYFYDILMEDAVPAGVE